MWIKILILAVILMAGLAAFIALQPSEFRITRTLTMSAPAATLFAQVNDFHHWYDWSPWAKIDPNVQKSYEGPSSGIGAIFRWSGNKEVGKGSMTITESHPSDIIRIKLEFFEPFQATNIAEFTFRPQGAQTLVSWSMSGEKNFIAKAMGLIMNCDKMLGTQFEKGLTQMKSVVESTPQPTF